MTKDEGRRTKDKELITSKDNSRLKHARAVRDGRERGEIFIEGLRLAEEAVGANLKITDAFFTAEFAQSERGSQLIEKIAHFRTAKVSEKLLESISDTKTPQGIILLAEKPETGSKILESAIAQQKSALLVVLHELNNPSNVGAILRAAEAAGANGVILTQNCADLFSPKSLRAAMGSAFRLATWTNSKFSEAIEFCHRNQIKTVCAALTANKTHLEIDWTAPRALVIGSEARGLSPQEIAACDESLKIPMRAPVESLNAAVACGVVLYEAARQKSNGFTDSAER